MTYDVPCQIGNLAYYVEYGKKWLCEVEEIRIKKDSITIILYNPIAPATRKIVKAEDFGVTIFPHSEKDEKTEPHPSEFATHVYGYSDDTVVVRDKSGIPREINCYKKEVRVYFTDGTIIETAYDKRGDNIWDITVVKKGTADQFLHICDEEDNAFYTDTFMLNADYDHSETVVIH